jgi:glycogen debranching enzyme
MIQQKFILNLLLTAFLCCLTSPFVAAKMPAQNKALPENLSSHSQNPKYQQAHISVALVTSLQPGTPELDSLINAAASDEVIHIQIISPQSLQTKKSNIQDFQVVWIHSDDSNFVKNLAANTGFLQKINDLAKTGTGLWLTHEACRLVVDLGWEKEKPQFIEKTIADEGYGRMAGYHARLSHPIFKGLNSGCYVLKPHQDLKTKVIGYFGEKFPVKGKVVAADWDYIFLREEKKVIWEYSFPQSKALLTGGYLYFAEPNINKSHLKHFTTNCLHYLAGDPAYTKLPAFYWDYGMPGITWMQDWVLPNSPSVSDELQNLDTLQSPLVHTHWAEDAYIQVSGSRIIAMGTEKAGIREIWAHPFMALRDYSIRLILPDTLIEFTQNGPKPLITIEPGYCSRKYFIKNDTLVESLMAHPDSGVWIANYKWSGQREARLEISFRSNLRLMWPYSEKVNPEIRLAWDKSKRAIGLTDESGLFAVVAGSLNQPLEQQAGRDTLSEELAVRVKFVYAIQPYKQLHFIVAAGNDGLPCQIRRYASTAGNPLTFNKIRKQRIRDFFGRNLRINTPDPKVNEAWKWLMAGVNSFYIETPGMARSLVAGHNTTGTGWDGGHRVDGRPGYAWYFGRDAEWSSMALLDYGDFDKVKDVLCTLARYQDLNGKIFHELTTSGFAHYDAADATPLFIVLAGRYYKHSGDTALLRQLWPALVKAFHFCQSTDTDHDHLIENTNVGHGWVEGGPLFGCHTTLYLASCWNEALKSMAEIATCLGEHVIADYCNSEAQTVNTIINQQFWNNEQGHFNQGLMKDGSWHSMPSILPSIPALFNQMEETQLQSFINLTAGNEYITNYGSRIISKLSQAYRPNGYHAGSVWPLFTGWHALAAWRAGRAEVALPLTYANLMIYNDWGFGYNEEVLNGDIYKPSGVCRHQCWSETMALQPVVEGMLGFQPDAPCRTLTFAPNIPGQWDFLQIENLRCGNDFINVSMQKKSNSVSWSFLPKEGEVKVNFRPIFNFGETPTRILLNGNEISFTVFPSGPNGIYPDIEFFLNKKTDIVIEYQPGFTILTPLLDLNPGDKPEGLRILGINADMENKALQIEVQAPANSQYTLNVMLPGDETYVVENAEAFQEGKSLTLKINTEKEDTLFIRKTIKVLRRK